MQTMRSEGYVEIRDYLKAGSAAYGNGVAAENFAAEDELALSDDGVALSGRRPSMPIRAYFDARYDAAYASWRSW